MGDIRRGCKLIHMQCLFLSDKLIRLPVETYSKCNLFGATLNCPVAIEHISARSSKTVDDRDKCFGLACHVRSSYSSAP